MPTPNPTPRRVFNYTGTLKRDGTPCEGSIVADSADEARRLLIESGDDAVEVLTIEGEITPEQRAAANPAPVAESDYAAASEDNTGFCIVCRSFTTGCCEPDARQYKCEQCGGMTVYGAEECLVHGFITFTEGGGK